LKLNSSGLGQGQVAGSSENDSEYLFSMKKTRKFLTIREPIKFSKMTLLHEVVSVGF